MDRRRFLQLFGGGVVASATMAEAGFLADFMAWLKRKPVWSIPKEIPIPRVASGAYALYNSGLATIYYDRKAIDAIKRNLSPLYMAIEKHHPLPGQREKSIQMLNFALSLGELD